MNRNQKIANIKKGTHVILNDMKGDDRVLDVLNECDILKPSDWNNSIFTKHNYFGIDVYDTFYFLSEHELNNRPQYLISELVGNGEGLCNCTESQWCVNCYEEKKPMLFQQPPTQKEVFTEENLHNVLQYKSTFTEIANKLNKMAFDAYK